MQVQYKVLNGTIQNVMIESESVITMHRQMMSFECGLRRKERELKSSLQQKERLIKEQAAVIRFLLRKKEEGVGKKNIGQLHDEAQAKIPQVSLSLLTHFHFMTPLIFVHVPMQSR